MEYKVGFLKGMDQDSSISKRDQNSYYSASNIKVITNDGLSTGSIINEKGNKLLFKIPDINGWVEPKIIGLGTMREWIVIATLYSDGTAGNGQIWKCRYDQVNEFIKYLNGDYLVNAPINDYHLVYDGILNFDINYRVEFISRYQDSTHGKVYIVDGLNPIKHINILDTNSLSLSLSEIEIVPDIVLSQPQITKVLKGGSLRAGSIQYSYQLFNQGGAESAFAPASGIAHLTSSNEYANNTTTYEGAANDTNVGKSVRVHINNIDTNFDYIRLISAFYTSKEGQPEISIIEEKSVPPGGSIDFTDDGNPIGVYSINEYNSTGSRLFIPWTVCTKNNYLIAANIKEQYFDIDEEYGYWDARAYRWKSSFTHIYIDGAEILNPLLSSIAEDEDCVCLRTDQEIYKYNANTSNLGGAGINISYEFELRQVEIDSNADDTTSYVGSDLTPQSWSIVIDSTYTDNDSYTSYASPLNRSQIVGYFRDEIYRFGIVFYDAKGRQSFVKWIGDIKMPRTYDIDTKITYSINSIDYYDYNTVVLDSTSGVSYANILGVKFMVDNVPSGLSYRIVRVRREEADKYILGQGLAGWTIDEGIYVGPVNNIYWDGDKVKDYVSTSYGAETIYEYLLTLKSPEVLFDNSILPQSGDYIDVVALSDTVTTLFEDYGVDGVRVFIDKIKSSLIPNTAISAEVVDGIKVEDTSKLNNTYRYVIQNGGTIDRYLNHNNAYKGSCLAIGIDTPIALNTLSGAFDDSRVILNYRKDSSFVQYGGNSFTDRVNNTYIACGNLYSGASSTMYVYSGDTYICMWEYINSMMYADNMPLNLDGSENPEIVYIPLETTINTEIKHGSAYSRGDKTNRLCETSAFGTSIFAGSPYGDYPADLEDVYQYNPAYSAEPIGKTFTIKPLFFENNQVNDYRIIVSEKHINNQLSDNWTKFLYNNLIEVNSAYGPISKITTSKNRLYFFQDNAFGVVGFEDRQLLNDSTGSQLTLGVGTILSNYIYISEKNGSKSKFGVIDTGDTLYFLDVNNRNFMKFNGQSATSVSDAEGMSGFFKSYVYEDILINDSTSNGVGVHGVFDTTNDRVIYSLLNSSEGTTIGFNELMGKFESFYSFLPTIYENTDNGVISVNPDNLNECYIHGNGNNGVFYGQVYPSSVTTTFCPNPDNKKVFTNIEFNSYVSIAGVDEPLDTIDLIRLWTSFQDTTDIVLSQPTNLRRRFRTWRYQIPKDSGLRFMDYGIFAKMQFTNDLNTNKYFRLDDITMHYLLPMI